MSDDVFRWVIAVGVILAALSFIVQATIVTALYFMARKTQKKVMPLVDRVEPIVDTTSQLVQENRPRLSEIAAEVSEIARIVRAHTVEIGDLVRETSERLRARIAKIDETVDDTVEQVEQVGDAVKTAVMKPMREVNALVAGLKAALAAYAASGRRSAVEHATQDEEMFI